MTDIEKTEAEIKVLQKKLELLKEIETHKSQPRMEFDCGGKFEVVSYNGQNYYRLEYDEENYSWFRAEYTIDGMMLCYVGDYADGAELLQVLETLWINDVKKGKYDEPYKNVRAYWEEK
jgi:hypothetical protein